MFLQTNYLIHALFEINDEFKFISSSVNLSWSTKLDTEDSEVFITTREIPINQGEYTPIGKVICDLDFFSDIKIEDKSI